jgi:hypothetical protein
MLVAEKSQPEAAIDTARGLAEPGLLDTAAIYGRRRVETNAWQPQDHIYSLILAPPHSEKKEDGAIVLSTSEMSMEKVSLSSGAAVIELTDEEAQQIADSFGEDAYPPQ